MEESVFTTVIRRPLQRTAQFLRLAPALGINADQVAPRNLGAAATQQRSNRAAASDLLPGQELFGSGDSWAKTEFGSYYATSVSVYAAVKLRADAVSRPTLRIFREAADGVRQYIDSSHPVAQLLNQVNPWSTQIDLWRATEIYLNLWGSAFWALERDAEGRREIWPLRPDRVTVLPDRRQPCRSQWRQTGILFQRIEIP